MQPVMIRRAVFCFFCNFSVFVGEVAGYQAGDA